MTDAAPRTLVLGYGNPARQDDGLGPEAARRIEQLGLPGVTVETGYQLTVEDSETVAHYDVVVFVDASVEGEEPFRLAPVSPRADVSFSTHSVGPDQVLGLAERLFRAAPRGYTLGIRGLEFGDFGETLSEAAQANLEAALRYLASRLQEGTLAAAPDRAPLGAGPTARG